MIDKLFAGAIVLLTLGALGYVLWTFSLIVDGLFEHKARERLLKDMRAAVKVSQPPWDQVLEIARSRGVEQRGAYIVVRGLLREVLTGAESDLLSHRALLEGYLVSYRAAEPFEGLPSETRVHLERLREALGNRPELLEPLTTQVRELVSVYEKDKSRQRLYTVWGFIFGTVGLLFAAYAYFFPYIPAQAPVPGQPSAEVAPR